MLKIKLSKLQAALSKHNNVNSNNKDVNKDNNQDNNDSNNQLVEDKRACRTASQ